MDIINPEIIVLGKRYYRNNIVINNEAKKDLSFGEYEEEPCDYEDLSTTFEVKQEGNDFLGHIDVPVMFIGFVIGKGGEAKKRIEFDTQTVLKIPKSENSGRIDVKGKSSLSVDRALTRISMLIEFGRSKSQFTHFLSVQINNNDIQSSFERFRDAVLCGCVGDRGVDESVFQRTYKLHVTICIMVLGDQNEINNSLKVCQQFQNENSSLFTSPFEVRIRGIDCMNDDPCEVRVLYAKVESGHDGDRLQSLADGLVKYLADQRVIAPPEHPRVTLHMTLMNCNYNRDRDMGLDIIEGGGDTRTIDCSNIMKKFSDWDFGVLSVREVQLSRRHSVHPGTYYPRVGSFVVGGGQ